MIASFNARGTIAACLDSLRRQRTRIPFEILLVDSSEDGTADLVRAHYPEVHLIVSARRLHCGAARNRALERVRADVVAFLDADCTVGSRWVDTVVKAHDSDYLLIGGVVDNAVRRGLVGWAYYFCEYSLWLPVRSRRVVNEVAGCCLSLKRRVYDQYGPFIEGTYSSDTEFQWKTSRDGHRVLLGPEIRVHHQGPTGLGRLLAHTFEHRRDYARVRCQVKGLSAARRLLEAAFLPLTPLLLLGAVLLRLRRCMRYLPYYLLCAPLLFLAYCARSCGEFAGYLRPRPASRGRPRTL